MMSFRSARRIDSTAVAQAAADRSGNIRRANGAINSQISPVGRYVVVTFPQSCGQAFFRSPGAETAVLRFAHRVADARRMPLRFSAMKLLEAANDRAT